MRKTSLDVLRVPEDPKYEFSQQYAFTVTLPPLMYRFTAEEQLSLTAEKIRCVLQRSYINKLTMVAELTEDYNIHYHGIIQVNLSLLRGKYEGFAHKWICDALRIQCVGKQKKIKVVDDEGGWMDYLIKDIKKTKLILHGDCIIRDDFKIWEHLKDKPEGWVYVSKKLYVKA